MQIRDRIKALRRVRAGDLVPNPKNWRLHPAAQRDALRGVLAEVGYASALLVRENERGELELIDGHLRAETTPDALVPVLELDVTAAEAEKILLTHDPLAAMAEVDRDRVHELLDGCEFQNPQVAAMLDQLAQKWEPPSGRPSRLPSRPRSTSPKRIKSSSSAVASTNKSNFITACARRAIDAEC